MFLKKIGLSLITSLLFFSAVRSQSQNDFRFNGQDLNAIQTVMPFLTIAPDSRSGGMGDVGVATDPDISSQHWNVAKYAFIEDEAGFTISYTPWLRNLIDDINLAYLGGYKRIDNEQVVSASLRYFSLGTITFTDQNGNYLNTYSPNEFAIDAGYSRLFTDNLSGGIAFRFIYSNLTAGTFVGGAETKAGIAVAGDLGFFYTREIDLSDKDANLNLGFHLSNMGNKVTYSETAAKGFLPINMRLGGALKIHLDDYNTMSFAADVNKLLVPTPPIYYNDSVDNNGEPVIALGKDPEVPVPVGMIQSFYDAPGVIENPGDDPNVLKEELRELMFSAGVEYWYRNQFAARAGYFHEHQSKGNRKYFTAGVGIKLNVFALDFAYLIPAAGRNNPLANTVRFTLTFEFSKYRSGN